MDNTLVKNERDDRIVLHQHVIRSMGLRFSA
jgi:hypothetical protein